MDNTQLFAIVAASAPTMITVMIGILINNARLGDLRHYIDQRFNQVDQGFKQVDQRFDQMEKMWRGELRRVEEVIDARLRHLEER
jgi:hypothetical protein